MNTPLYITRPSGSALVAWLVLASAISGIAQPAAPVKRAVPVDARTAIVDAFTSYPLVALGETHGHREGEDFLLDLIADARFAGVASDIVVEGGMSTDQPLVDRFIAGDDVSLQRGWRDAPSMNLPSITNAPIAAPIGTGLRRG